MTEAGAHATHEQDTGKYPSSSIKNEFLAQPGSSVWSSNDVSPIDTEVDDLIVPDLISRKRKSKSKGREEIGEEASIGVDPPSIVVTTPNINSKSKRRKYYRKMKVIDSSDTNKPSSDFDPSSVVVRDLQINTSPNVGDSSTVVPISGVVVLDGPLKIAVDPNDYKSKDDPISIVTDNSNLKENRSPTAVQPDQPSPVQSSDSKPSLSEQPLRCSQCNYETVKRHLFEIHTQTHFGKRFLDCDVCEFKTSIRENLVAHMRTNHVKKERYNCKRCDAILSIVEKYAYHLFRHKGNTIFKCSACNFIFTNETFLDRHKTLRHSPLYFKCRFCDFCSATSTNLRDHVRNEHEQSM